MKTTLWMAAALAVLLAAQAHAQENPWRSPLGPSTALPYEYPSFIDTSPGMTYETGRWMDLFPAPFQQPFEQPSYAPAPRADLYSDPYDNPVLRRMEFERQRAESILDSYRRTAPQRWRNALTECAQYNVGCARELWGMSGD